jgi:hypothetical protein
MAPCKSLELFISDDEAEGWGTCTACGRFMPVKDGVMKAHDKPTGNYGDRSVPGRAPLRGLRWEPPATRG